MHTLAALLASPRGHRVLLTVREEFRAQVSGLQGLSTWLTPAAWYQINPMPYEALKAAVEEPARAVGLQFQPGVTDDLVRRVLGQPAALPLLQYALGRLWAMRDRNRITHEVYARLGDPLQALMRSADEFYAPLAPQTQKEVRRVLLALVRIDERLDVYRQPRFRQELLTEGNAQTADAIDRLLRQGYVRSSHLPSEADERISICHEALVRNWPRLVDWIDEERRVRQQRMAFSMAASRWDAGGRPQQGLMTGWQLDGVREHAQRLSGIEREFFDASLHALEAAQNEQLRQAKAARDQALRLVEEERQRRDIAEQQTQQAQRLAATEERLGRSARWQRNGVLIATSVLVAATGYLVWQNHELKRKFDEAQATFRQANEAQMTADQRILAQRPDDPTAQTDWQFVAELNRNLYGPASSAWSPGSGGGGSPAAQTPAAEEATQVRVFLHIASAAQRPRAVLLAAELRRGGVEVPGIEVVAAKSVPSRSDVRYFNAEDQPVATQIATAMRSTLSDTAETKPKLITGRAEPVPRGHIELWFALDALQPAGSPGIATPTPSPAGPSGTAAPPTSRVAEPPAPAPAPPAAPLPPPAPHPAAQPTRPAQPAQTAQSGAAPQASASPAQPATPPAATPAAAPPPAPAAPPAAANPHSRGQRVQLLIYRLEHHGQRATQAEGLNVSHRLRLDWAENWARYLNVQTPLGLAVLYDTDVSLRTSKLLDKPVQPLPKRNRGAEKAWLLHYLDLRADPAENPKAQEPLERQRIAELRRLIQAEQWDLDGERPGSP